eukprot:Nk52_evm27s160 gene=Nk52_evmTU27s160
MARSESLKRVSIVPSRLSIFSVYSTISSSGIKPFIEEQQPQQEEKEATVIALTSPSQSESYEEAIHEWENNRRPSDYVFYVNLGIFLIQMANYYVTIPSSPDLVEGLNGPDYFSGVLLAAMCVASFISSIYWPRLLRYASFKTNILASLLICTAGNLIYALSEYSGSIWVLFASRLVIGLGVCQSLQMEWFARSFGNNHIREASNKQGAVLAFGVAAGAVFAGVLSIGSFSIASLNFNSMTLPGWFMALMYMILFFFVLYRWEDPAKCPEKLDSNGSDQNAIPSKMNFQKGMTIYLYAFPVASTMFVMSAFEASSPLVTADEFNWGVTEVSIFLGVLGFLYVPLSLVFSKLIELIEDRRYILLLHGVCLAGVVLLFKYPGGASFTFYQYGLGGLITFAGVEALVSAILAVVAKTNPINSSLMFNTGTIIIVSGSYGRVLGSLWGTAFPNSPNQENYVMAGVVAVYALSLTLSLLSYKSMGKALPPPPPAAES